MKTGLLIRPVSGLIKAVITMGDNYIEQAEVKLSASFYVYAVLITIFKLRFYKNSV